tara:strand:+ start:21585 stop:22427 length:843 start_codon:yes stop_codon:yes gene_type:complete
MKIIATIIDNFDKRIYEVNRSNLNKLNKLKENIKITKSCLQQLRLEVRRNDFKNIKSEINFFKHQKPYVQGRLNFYINLNNYLLKYPPIGILKQENYIHREFKKLDVKKNKHLVFVKYYRLAEENLDQLYFLRRNNQLDLFIETYHYDDPDFSTSHDYVVSQIICQDLLTKFYAKELETLEAKNIKIKVEEVKPKILADLPWTASKTELAELVISLIAFGAIKNGNVDMKKIAEGCKELFGVDLGNIYNTYAQIKSRKKDPTKFLDKLKFSLIKKLEADL